MPTIHTSPYPDVEIPDLPVHAYVFEEAASRADKIAIVDGPSGRSYTYGTLVTLIESMAGGLTERGFGKGDVLAIVAPNLPEYAIAFHAVSRVGGTVTTVNPTYGAEEIGQQFRDSKATLAITIGMFLETVQAAAKESGVREIFVLGDADGGTPVTELFGEPFSGDVEFDVQEDVAVLPYSSGTTGMPKGVMLTHHNLVANLCQMQPVLDGDEDDVYIAVLPFFHIYGMQVLMNGVLRVGAKIVTMPRFDLQEFLSLIQEHKVTKALVVPPIVLAMAKHPMVDEYDLSSLTQAFSGAAPLSAELAAAAAERLGCEVVQGYGLTETSPVSNASPPGKYRAGTVGVLVPNQELRLVDPESGEDVALDTEGEIWFRGPNVMKGYFGREEDTAAMLDADGWLHTGDIGRIDADGYLSITDRLKELIKYKGFQVPPAELEGLLLSHPAIADVAVIGVADEEAGELPKAYVVVAPGSEITEDEVKEFSKEKLATYKQIRLVEFIDEIPKSASGKILRRLLRDRENA